MNTGKNAGITPSSALLFRSSFRGIFRSSISFCERLADSLVGANYDLAYCYMLRVSLLRVGGPDCHFGCLGRASRSAGSR